MREDNGRKLSRETLEEIRIRAVMRVEAGESPEDVIRTMGFSRARIRGPGHLNQHLIGYSVSP